MRMNIIAGCAFLLNTVFFATYYSVTKEVLNRIDPIIFTFFEMVLLAPAGLVIILFSWKDMRRTVVKRGILLGSTLCLALFTIAIALKYTTATSTAFFPALNGFVAALIAWALFREPMKRSTWLAGGLSVGGAALLIFTSPMGNFRGTLIAFLGGLFYTGYIFLCDHEQHDERAQWPLFGVELLTTALWANLVALLFGNWQAVHPVLPKDVWVVLYVASACTFIPTLITVLFQKYISPVTVSFIYILEPVLGACIATVYLGEVLPLPGYIGGGLVVLGALINCWSTLGRPADKAAQDSPGTPGRLLSTLLYPALGCVLGALLLSRLGGIPPASWREVYAAWPRISQYFQQGQTRYVALLLVQAGSWLVAWLSVLLMGSLALSYTLSLLFRPARQLPRPRTEHVERHAYSSQSLPARPLPRSARSVTLSPERVEPRGRSLERLPERPAPRVTRRLSPPTVPHQHTAGHLPEQPAWYGETIWHMSSHVNTGPITPIPATEPLPHEMLPAPNQRMSVYVDRLDA